MNPNVLEFVSFRLKQEVTDESFLEAARRSQLTLQRYEGFVGRDMFYHQESGLRFDLVEWRDKHAAKRASESFLRDSAAAAFLDVLDASSVDLQLYSRLPELDIASANGSEYAGNCVELICFQLKSEKECPYYLRYAEEMGRQMQAAPGFIRRSVFRSENTGEWLEVIRYSSRAEADALFAKLQDEACMQKALQLVDEQTLQLYFVTPEKL